MNMIDRRSFVVALAGAVACPSIVNASPNFELKADMAARFSEAGTEGVFAVLRLRDNKLIATDEGRMRQPFIPASTFKVPHALIALETGVVADADKEIIHWDGQVRSIDAWNKDHTLRSAMAVSAVPVYQQIARRILSELRPGRNIVLQHDGVNRSPISVAAVSQVVRVAKRRGYCFTALNERGRPGFPPPTVTAVAKDGVEGGEAVVRLTLDRAPGRDTALSVEAASGTASVGADLPPFATRVEALRRIWTPAFSIAAATSTPPARRRTRRW